MKINSMKDVPVGSVLELFNGKSFLYIGIADDFLRSTYSMRKNEHYIGLSHDGYMTFKEDFTTSNSDWNIVKIYEPHLTQGVDYGKGHLLHEVSRKMTLAEIEKKLGYKIILKEK